LNLPAPVTEIGIVGELDIQLRQRQLFQKRIKLGPEVTPFFYQPVFETDESILRAVFIAPGEVHMVFLDEIAPSRLWDEWYRQLRIENLGRKADIESIEINESQVIYHWCYSFANVYETGIHYSGRQKWTGSIFSNTWNHMLSNSTQLPVLLRGGYKLIEPEIHYGGRDAAEDYAKKL
jgi:hypothetical protein